MKIDKLENKTLIIILFYLLTCIFIISYLFIGFHLQQHIYFHPSVSIFVRVLLILDIVIIPIIISIRSTIKKRTRLVVKVLKIGFTTFGLFISGMILATFIVLFFDRGDIMGLYTEKIVYQENYILLEYGVWLDNNHISTFEKEGFLFIRRIDDYEIRN